MALGMTVSSSSTPIVVADNAVAATPKPDAIASAPLNISLEDIKEVLWKIVRICLPFIE
jgi:hypothetical protein